MSKYKVGDKVRIRSDIHEGRYGGCSCIPQMCEHAGKVVTVREIVDASPNRFTIKEHLAECGCEWHWSDEMVESYMEEKKMFTKSDLKTGMFGVMDNGFKFVVVNDSLIYSNGEWDRVDNLDENLEMYTKKVMKVYDNVVSFNHLNGTSNRPIYDRERDTKKLYNGKVVCIDNCDNKGCYTVGKIYQFKDGAITCDDGFVINYDCLHNKFYTFEDWSKFSSSKWIEVVE